MKTRRHAFALAAALTATIVTGIAAIGGLAQRTAHPRSAAPVLVQTVAPAATAPRTAPEED